MNVTFEEVGVVRAPPNRADAACLVRLGFVSTSFGRVHARQAPQRQAGVQSTAVLQGQAEEPETSSRREGGGRKEAEGGMDGGMEGWMTDTPRRSQRRMTPGRAGGATNGGAIRSTEPSHLTSGNPSLCR